MTLAKFPGNRLFSPVAHRGIVLAIIFSAILCHKADALTAAQAAGLDLGMDNNYAAIFLGNNNTPIFGLNSGPIGGDVLIGLGERASFSAGGNGGLSNGCVLYYDNTVTGQNTFNSLPNQLTTQQVSTTLTMSARQIAQNVSAFAASLAPTQTFGNMPGTTTITGNGGLNVIDVTNMHSVTLTLNGSASDYFVFNVSGLLDTNRQMTLSPGVDASHILFNFTGSGAVFTDFQTSSGDRLYGTFLSTNGGKFQFQNLDLTGQLINVGGDVQFVTGSHMDHVPFVPEPSTNALIAIAAVILLTTTVATKIRRRA